MTQKFHDLVAGARSYRRFDQSKKMTMQELEELAELGRITPCGGNRQYIRFPNTPNDRPQKYVLQ